MASTLDYQFGFKVSQTWFYQLLEKAILPLILFMIAVIYLFSCVVIVGPGEGAVIEHLGSADTELGGRQVGPGWSWKWPWPFEQAYKYPMQMVQQVNVGFVPDEKDRGKPMLWGEKHYQEEYKLLVAVETGGRAEEDGAAPISYVNVNVPVHYKISNLHDYLYNHQDTPAMLEAICYRQLARFAASAKIEPDEDSSSTGPKSLLGAGRRQAALELQQRIQQSADKAKLGVEIVFLGLQAAHPPAEVATDYQEVVAAVQRQQTTILQAQAERNKILTELAGSIAEVDALYALLQESKAPQSKVSEKAKKELEAEMRNAQGKVYATLRRAEAYSVQRVALLKGKGLRFAGQVQANQANPQFYQHLQRLLMLEEALESIRKYIVVADEKDQEIYMIDLKDQMASGLLEGMEDAMESVIE